jgi:pSer/pThr/pTyr-binding forkhead associated (FHA) protein
MALTVVVLSAQGARLTFDGTQRVVIGRGAGSDVRLPDASVSVRHASLRAQGSDFVVVDEGSTNGTFVGSVRVAAQTSRLLRSGDRLRLGRVWLEVRIDQAPVTRDVAAATRDIALALVSQALESRGAERSIKVRVVEGPDQGAELSLVDEGTPYVIGRAAHCQLALADPDASREHARIERRGGAVWVRDGGAKNGTWLGDAPAPAHQDVVWRPPLMMRIGRTVLALFEPVSAALATIESAPDEAIDPSAVEAPPPDAASPVQAAPSPTSVQEEAPAPAPRDEAVPRVAKRVKPGHGWSTADALVMGAALCVLALSLAGLVWLLRG